MEKTKVKGTINQISRFIATSTLFDKETVYDAVVTVHRDSASIHAMHYYWLLSDAFADYNRVSKIRQHNMNLIHYGQACLVEDGHALHCILPDSDVYLDSVDYHLRPYGSSFEKDGKKYREYVMLRGCSTYNSREMAILIDGLISEIEGSDADIQTLTPDELQKLKGYGYGDVSKKGKRKKKN